MPPGRPAAAKAIPLTGEGLTKSCALPLPNGVTLRRIDWPTASVILSYHLIALLAFIPWTFSWTGVIVIAWRRVSCCRFEIASASALVCAW